MELGKLKRHLENTPLSELRKEWESIKEFAKGSPAATELVHVWSEIYTDEFNPKVKWKFKDPKQNKKLKETPKYSEFFFNITPWKIKQQKQHLV